MNPKHFTEIPNWTKYFSLEAKLKWRPKRNQASHHNTSGVCFLICCCSWKYMKQATWISKVIWLQCLFCELGVFLVSHTLPYADNTRIIQIATNLIFHEANQVHQGWQPFYLSTSVWSYTSSTSLFPSSAS